jgi:hypothetical protein
MARIEREEVDVYSGPFASPDTTESRSLMQAVKGFSMEKWLCWVSMGVAGLLFLLFALDFAIRFPFNQVSRTVDILGVVASALVFYLAWDAYKDIK